MKKFVLGLLIFVALNSILPFFLSLALTILICCVLNKAAQNAVNEEKEMAVSTETIPVAVDDVVDNEDVAVIPIRKADDSVYNNTVAKDWIKTNYSYINQLCNDTIADSKDEVVISSNLPDDKKIWKEIGRTLLKNDVILGYTIVNDGLKLVLTSSK